MNKQTFPNEVVTDVDSSDYLRFVSITSSKEQREKFMIGDIFINAAVCLKCHKYIRSKNLHDFVRCNCGAVAVDGGSHYGKRVGNKEDYISIIEEFYDK